MCRFLTLFVFGLCLCSHTFAQEESDSLFQLSDQFSLALEEADLSPKQARILVKPYKNLIEGLQLYVSQQKQTSDQVKDLLTDLAEVRTSLNSERQAREAELFGWKVAAIGSGAALLATLAWVVVDNRK